MKINYKKITAIAASALMVGMTMGVAAAANYPAPFVSGGSANVAIVYGTGAGVSALDVVQAGNIQANLQTFLTGTSSGSNTVVSTSGEVSSLDTSASRIYLNSSLNGVKTVLTNLDLPKTLAITNFNGNVNTQVTPSIVVGNGTSAGADNSGKVILTKQPGSNIDPAVALSMGVASSTLLYNTTLTFTQAVNFTDSNSIGQTLSLFGGQYTVSSSTSSSNGLVLYGSSQTVTLSQGGSTSTPTATVTIGGVPHTITLANVGTTTAYISVDGSATQSVSTSSSKLINGVNIAVTNIASSTAGGNTATILVGAQQLSFLDGQQVQIGTSNTPIQGTMVSFQGGTVGALSKLTVGVFAPDTLHNVLSTRNVTGNGLGPTWVDPVFGGFQLAFGGLANSADVTQSGVIITNSGNTVNQVTFTDWNSNKNTIYFANNQTSFYNLSDSSGNSIYPFEAANLSLYQYAGIGNQNYGHLVQLSSVVNNSNGQNNKVVFTDIMSATTYTATATSGSTTATLNVDGRQYTVYYGGSGATAWAQIKYPTGDSSSSGFVLYPTIQTKNSAQLIIYSPLLINLQNFSATTFGSGLAAGGTNGSVMVTGTAGLNANVGSFLIPNGNGYTTLTVTNTLSNGSNNYTWTIGGKTVVTNASQGLANASVAVGALTYEFVSNSTANWTRVYLVQPGNTTPSQYITTPSIINIEGKDVNNVYNAVVINTQNPSANSNLVGVSSSAPYFSATNYQSGSKVLQSNNKLTQFMDYMGTLVQTDTTTSNQMAATLWNVPGAVQSYAQLYVGSVNSTVLSTAGSSGAGSLGNVLVKDSETSSVATKNLVVVGGSCINAAAAKLVGGAYCGADWTTASGVGAGQFLIKGYATSSITSGVALLVAGYEAADTVNAATYLTTQAVDTSKSYKGTTSTSATLVTS